jgi:Cof subfamily protein (haloacid dehalogenase superfamily)
MPHLRIEAVVADLDGTLVAQDSSVSAATIQALSAIRVAGIPLVLATGRAPTSLRGLDSVTRYAAIAVCCSGAVGCAGSSRLWQFHLTRAAVSQVAGTAERFGAGMAGFDGAKWHATEMFRALRPNMGVGMQGENVTASMLAGLGCVSMALVHTRGVLTEIARVLAGHEVRTGLSQVAGQPILDVTSPDADKGTGVLRALSALGADPAAAVSFGDMPNDIPMFAVTGCAFAVGAQHPAVAAAVRETLDPAEQDGFARKIFDLAVSDWKLP